MNCPKIDISEFSYDLPQDRIATYPAQRRDASKLLIYNKGVISDTAFTSLPSMLAPGSLMIFNNTKVVPARLLFRKSTGALIEIFCLEPHDPKDYSLSFASDTSCVWKVIIGNKKKWKDGDLELYTPQGDSELESIGLRASMAAEDENGFYVRFSWKKQLPFSQVLDMCGKIPIPPYLNRETQDIDLERYQTTYALIRGSVAAPTAGLHFTDSVLEEIDSKGIHRSTVCLHVGAGTFLPVKSRYISGHQMHSEPFSISLNTLEHIYKTIDNGDIIAVGTTSVRTLESLYYMGLRCYNAVKSGSQWCEDVTSQWEPYNTDEQLSPKQSIESLLDYMTSKSLSSLTGRTRIIIVPSYKFKFVTRLVTNFHQPQSTLLLLIAAFIGEDWKRVYEYAMKNGFRFLSYGDSSLLIP